MATTAMTELIPTAVRLSRQILILMVFLTLRTTVLTQAIQISLMQTVTASVMSVIIIPAAEAAVS
jgi:hypothetical protein